MYRPILTAIAFSALITAAIAEPTRSGRAHVEWLSTTSGYTPGEPVVTALKMTLDKGWHTYWSNPGEAGMPLSVDFNLPPGWTADAPQHPFPIRFKTGELADFGYEGTVLFPITLHPPAESPNDAIIKGSFSWLACDDSACVPGDAVLTLTLNSGDTAATSAATEIAEAMQRVPQSAPDGWKLGVSESGDSLILHLSLPAAHDFQNLDVFPLTLNTIHPAATFEWHPTDGSITASVPKSPFAPDQIESLELVISAPTLDRPITVGWNAK